MHSRKPFVKPVDPDEPTTKVVKLPELNTQLITRVTNAIEAETALETAEGEELTVTEVADEFAAQNGTLVGKSRALLVGATPEMVYVEFVKHLAAARVAGDYGGIITCGIFAVSVAYSTSESWVQEYGSLKKPHMFQEAEIESREAVKATTEKKAVNWVANSNMNAHFVRIFGNMIVCAASNDGFLKKLGVRAGTFLSPPKDDDNKERSKIMKAAVKEMQEADFSVIREFVKDFSKYADVVSYMFGAAGGDISKSQLVVKNMTITYI